MNANTAFTVYNAAAGAGKTYTLVKQYLITLLTGEFKDSYKNILAITFTNMAVTEMKNRVVENLVAISSSDTPQDYQETLNDLVNETKIPEEKLKHKADRILKSILHNYAAFDIVTIDTFTHRVIRTFAHDLGIPMNFEIEMDTEGLIEEAVDAVVAKIGLDSKLTKLIVDFAISKLEEDKSWDITIELNKVAKLLFSENDRKHLDRISNKEIKDFDELKKKLIQRIDAFQKEVVSRAQGVLELIANKGIEHNDFTRGSVPGHFKKLAQGDTVDFKAAWKQDIHNASFYNAKLDEHKKEQIDHIRPTIEEAFLTTKKQVTQIRFLKNCIKNLTPLSVLNVINQELLKIKKEKRILLISEFNSIISKSIQDQPAPFIYERLGERYRDYFIDEFQDTSELQWNNLIPLVDNAVATETLTGKRGKITIVGDAKQAIYRWRGGKPEQFIELSLDQNPFSVKQKQVFNLPRNYRSHEEVVKFNNSFFTFLSKDFSDEKHKELYLLGNKQEVNSKKEGYVNISFIKAKNIVEEHEIYPQKVYDIILELREKGYQSKDICIIVRKQKEGVTIADYLTDKGVSIISSETLLLKNSPEVGFIVDLITWFVQPDNLLAKIKVLHFLSNNIAVNEKHSFLQRMIANDRTDFIVGLKTLGIDFSFDQLALRPFYDAIEYVISCFKLAKTAPAYVQFFLDIIFTYSQKHTEGMIGFLSYWNDKKDKLSIVAPKIKDAVQIMTIHKSKGLEFPCVIYPYANEDIYREIEPKTWFTVDKEEYLGFEEVFIDYNRSIEDYGSIGQKIVADRNAQLELDALNLQYVALTRAKEQLYVISKLDLTSKGVSNPNKFSGKLITYLKDIARWNDDVQEYSFGNPRKPPVMVLETKKSVKTIKLSHFDDSSKVLKVHIVTNSGKLWDTAQKDAIEKGNLIHDLMASIYTQDDVQTVIEEAYIKGEIAGTERKTLLNEMNSLVNHPELSKYFSNENIVFNEKDIISEGRFFRPDRIVVNKHQETTIIDYKTGVYMQSHAVQIQKYGDVLKNLGHDVKYKILVYFNEDITLKYV
ncbi:UvrD-helicase domain-containing protein [Aquimarina gracilis]|uniref:DNA 3'-5' helicase n=1 Tax=Aquimarina gracilis TaxID=874422 RepID=A0ABU6A134_9FLAO|nr:UvrD-helicase domain-containing protein [Aquimarina gracilis]MEB3347875.1 UvrD-helicase domain-containing protein [Aquimarina gracilis]